MNIKEIQKRYKMLDKGWAKIFSTPKKHAVLKWHGVKFEVWMAGFCHWNKILFIVGGKEVYILKKDKLTGSSGDNLRKEYFEGRLVRIYDGPQNCFIEFCELLACLKYFPNDKEFGSAGTSLGLDGAITMLYAKMYNKIFGQQRRTDGKRQVSRRGNCAGRFGIKTGA